MKRDRFFSAVHAGATKVTAASSTTISDMFVPKTDRGGRGSTH